VITAFLENTFGKRAEARFLFLSSQALAQRSCGVMDLGPLWGRKANTAGFSPDGDSPKIHLSWSVAFIVVAVFATLLFRKTFNSLLQRGGVKTRSLHDRARSPRSWCS
jgi:hypothetical protein